jgi:hypothetical protein
MHFRRLPAALCLLLICEPLAAQQNEPRHYSKVEFLTTTVGHVRRVPGVLRLTADSLVFRSRDGTLERPLDLAAIDSIYPLFGNKRTTGSVLGGWAAGGLAGALISRSQEEFVLIRVRGLDSTEVWPFKVPKLKAMEIGNAIWARWKARISPK